MRTTHVALVTGAASGIGFAAAVELSCRGFEVVVADIDGKGARRAATTIGRAIPIELDVTDPAAADAIVESVGEEVGAIDVLVNSAGIVFAQALHETSSAQWASTLAVNVTGVFNCCRAVLPRMMENRRGAIVNVASVAGLVALPERAAYCASKGAVISLTKSIAVDYVAYGIRANCVCPGSTATPWVDRLTAASSDPVAALDEIVARQPMGRLGTPTEVAAAIGYLASDDTAFMTGVALVIDGGLSAGLAARRRTQA